MTRIPFGAPSCAGTHHLRGLVARKVRRVRVSGALKRAERLADLKAVLRPISFRPVGELAVGEWVVLIHEDRLSEPVVIVAQPIIHTVVRCACHDRRFSMPIETSVKIVPERFRDGS